MGIHLGLLGTVHCPHHIPKLQSHRIRSNLRQVPSVSAQQWHQNPRHLRRVPSLSDQHGPKTVGLASEIPTVSNKHGTEYHKMYVGVDLLSDPYKTLASDSANTADTEGIKSSSLPLRRLDTTRTANDETRVGSMWFPDTAGTKGMKIWGGVSFNHPCEVFRENTSLVLNSMILIHNCFSLHLTSSPQLRKSNPQG